MILREKVYDRSKLWLTYSAFAIALAALVVALFIALKEAEPRSSLTRAPETALQRVQRTGVIRAAYGGFPPYTIVNPNEPDPNKRVSGFAVDMINEIAKRSSPELRVEWSNLNWETFRADMLSGKFDLVADAVYATIPKAEDFRLTAPFSYFGLAVGLVRIDEDRFKVFGDLDRPGITIALAQGYVSTEFARRELSKPTFKLVTVGKDAFSQLDEVLFGRADVALNDVPTVVQYARAHSTKVKALWIDNPPSWAAGGFVTKREDADLAAMLSTAIEIFKIDGTLARLDKKWKSLGYFEKLQFTPGAGLTTPEAQ